LSFLSEEECKRITAKVLALALGPETTVSIRPASGGNTRFALNDVSTSGMTETLSIRVTSRDGLRSGNAGTNQYDDESLADCVRRAEETARLAPENPETMPALGPQTYAARPAAFADDTAAASPEYRAKIVSAAITAAKAQGLEAAGFVQDFSVAEAYANSKGLFAFQRSTGVVYSLTARSGEAGSGWGGGTSNTLAGFETDAMTAKAVRLAKQSEKPVALEPGNYTAILSAECVADLAGTMFGGGGPGGGAGGGFDQRRIDEGRSFLSKFGAELKDGKPIFSDKVNLYSDPSSPDCPGGVYGQDGLPQVRRDWIQNGAVKALACSRFWAKKTGREPSLGPDNLVMTGGTQSLEELIAGCKRGVFVNRFWYVRPVDPQTNLFTGLTRDGCFLVEDGKITRAVKNFRWNETPVKMLRNIEAMGKTRRVITSERDLGSSLSFPDLRVTDFTFSSLSDAV
jgi:predicted Zn-dependent protease